MQPPTLETIHNDLEVRIDAEAARDPIRVLSEELSQEMGVQIEEVAPDAHFLFIEGNVPLLLTVPHGGTKTELPFEKRMSRLSGDGRARDITLLSAYFLEKYFGERPSILVNMIDRRYMDPNGNICENPPPFVDPKMAQAWKHYHLAVRAWERETEKGLHLAMHAYSTRNKIYPSSINRFEKGKATGGYEEPHLEVLPLSVQKQMGAAVVLGTHHRTTVDTKRGIDKQFAQAFHTASDDGFSGPLSVFVPSRHSETILTGRYELIYARNSPIDAMQVEMTTFVLRRAFDRVLHATVHTLHEMVKAYR